MIMTILCRYWTDNGACYFNTTGSNYTNYEDLFVGVKEDAERNGIPYRYVQVLTINLNYSASLQLVGTHAGVYVNFLN